MYLIKSVFKRFVLHVGVIFSMPFISVSQDLITLTTLPQIVDESSGVEVTGANKIWTFNDSGGAAALYLCDTLGNLIKTVQVLGAWNRDWEDIAQDNQGNFYIGNMGNNNNANTDLSIFKIPNPDGIAGNSVNAQLITFSYEDQYSFPPPQDSMNFDCEALIWYNNFLYLSTKHRTYPMATKLYRIPDAPGNYVAEKISTFAPGNDSPFNYFNYWITAGDISPDGTKLALLSHDKMWIFYNFSGDDFFSGQADLIQFSSSTQKEGICFVSNSKLYVTDEYLGGNIGRKLYKLELYAAPPLQTSLVEFRAEVKDYQVLLSWVTSPEITNLGFEIEHSVTGLEFVELDLLDVQSSSGTYNYLHINPGTGKNHYRLKILEINGGFQYSQVETVFVENTTLDIFPNPAFDHLFISGLNGESCRYEIKSLHGEIIQAGIIAGDRLSLNDMIPAVYFIEIAAGNQTIIKRFIRQ